MKLTKVWKVVDELTVDDVDWLSSNKYDVQVERNQIHFTMLSGVHSQVTMPDITKIIIRTHGDSAETMLCLKFGKRIILFNEFWEDEFHGCNVQF